MINFAECDHTRNDSTPVFRIVQEMPVFRYTGCSSTSDCFRKFISDSIRLPSSDCFGKVTFQFVVEKDGSVSNVSFLQGPQDCKGYESEVDRLISVMPEWIPGKQRGRIVRVMLTMSMNIDP